jgi:hypothetical protein
MFLWETDSAIAGQPQHIQDYAQFGRQPRIPLKTASGPGSHAERFGDP